MFGPNGGADDDLAFLGVFHQLDDELLVLVENITATIFVLHRLGEFLSCHLRSRPKDDGLTKSFTGRLEIVFHLQVGDLQGRPVIAKAIFRETLGREILHVIVLDTEKIAHRVLVFAAVEAAQDHAPAGALFGLNEGVDFLINPADKNLTFFAG